MHNNQHKASRLLVWAIFFLFAVSTFVKVNFSAAIAYFVNEGIFTKTNSGTIVAAFYLVYGLGQIVGAKFMLKFSPFKLALTGVFLSMLANICLCFSNNYYFVLAMWTVNGAVNCVMWPTSVRIASEYIDKSEKRFATKMLTISVAIAGILSYICITPVLEAFGWAAMFVVNAGTMLVMLILWVTVNLKTNRCLEVNLSKQTVNDNKAAEKKENEGVMSLIMRSGICFVLFIVLIRAMLDNGLKTWIPTMMMESYSISPTWAGMQTAVIYFCNIAGVFVLTPIFSRMENEVKRYIILFGFITPFIVLLVLVGRIPMLAALCSFIVVSCVCYFMNDLAVSIPVRISEKGSSYSGSVASLINGFGSVGVLTASVSFGYIAENFSWQTVIICCVCLSCIALILAIPGKKLWSKYLGKR